MSIPPESSTAAPLQKRFGLFQATALNMSNMIGVGPFITIPALMSCMGEGGPQALLGWIVALLITIPDGLVWGELGAAMPGSGGTYQYLREGFGSERWGRFMAFLFIWQFVLSGPLEIATAYVGVKQYLAYLWPAMTPAMSNTIPALAGLLVIFLLYRRIEHVAWITVALWIGVMITVGGVLVSGIPQFNFHRVKDFPPNAFSLSTEFFIGLAAATRIGIYDYLGYYNICYIGQEVRDPGRVIPRSILISIVLVAMIYIGINLSIIGTISWREFVPATDPPAPIASWLMERVHGKAVAGIFTWLVVWTALGSIFALILGYSRIPYAAAHDGIFFRWFGVVHPRGLFPHRSLLVVGGLSIVCAFLPLMTLIDALITTRVVVQFMGQIAALILLRRRAPEMPRPFRMWLYPLPAGIAFLGWTYVLVTTKPQWLAGGAIALLAGGAAFLLRARATREWPFAAASAGTRES